MQFTASAALKEKLDLSRDLLRHAIPSGDLGEILHRAIDLLIEDIMRRRFGKRRKKIAHDTHASASPTIDLVGPPAPTFSPPPATTAAIEPFPDTPPREPPPPSNLDAASATGRAVHRAICERDGLRCTWRGPDGTRCTSRAWLELDHRHPRGLGGPSNAANLRHLCKAHNRRAAEHVYGTQHIHHTIQREQLQRERARLDKRTQPTPTSPR